MIWFVVLCAVMVLAGIGVVAVPLWRARAENTSAQSRVIATSLLAISIGVVAAGLYARFGNRQWNEPARPAQASGPDINAMVTQLEQKLKDHPQDVDGWLMLGRSYVALSRHALAVNAYQQAYDLTQGKNVDAVIGLAEAMVLVDEASLTGKAGQLIEQALTLQPNSPKALWYGGLAALRAENLKLARDRFKRLLGMNPPEQVRNVLEREVQDLDQQLGEQAVSPKAVSQHSVRVEVTLAASLTKKISEPLSLFVLAREPGKGGAPLAVIKRSSADVPLVVELTEADAMLPTHSLANAKNVEVIARLSKSGLPTEQSGDYFGSAEYSFAEQGPRGAVKIDIDRIVP